ncbi:uncharacterized protein DS421_16g555800 [Arachis hypogaea]|nr:uncharacterized protein DS421_16g555800 [Arachis hypogaea]
MLFLLLNLTSLSPSHHQSSLIFRCPFFTFFLFLHHVRSTTTATHHQPPRVPATHRQPPLRDSEFSPTQCSLQDIEQINTNGRRRS